MKNNKFDEFEQTIAKLRDPQTGCPWDLQQTHQSLTGYLIEECYELIQAIDEQNAQNMKEELGDVLLQIFLHAQLASEKKQFTIHDVVQSIQEKIIRRHPHVFAKDNHSQKLSEQELHRQWQEIKASEKKSDPNQQAMSNQLLYAPALQSAHNIGQIAHQWDFDWDQAEEVLAKIEEEIQELKVELKKQKTNKIQEELGDVLFTMAQLCRKLNFDSEQILQGGNRKFTRRFNRMIEQVKEQKLQWQKLSFEEKHQFWQKVKDEE